MNTNTSNSQLDIEQIIQLYYKGVPFNVCIDNNANAWITASIIDHVCNPHDSSKIQQGLTQCHPPELCKYGNTFLIPVESLLIICNCLKFKYIASSDFIEWITYWHNNEMDILITFNNEELS